MNEKQTKEIIDHLLTELKKYVDTVEDKVNLALQGHGRALTAIESKLKKATEIYELNLRDNFAAAALMGLVQQDKLKIFEMGQWAYHMADAMLKERKPDGEEVAPTD